MPDTSLPETEIDATGANWPQKLAAAIKDAPPSATILVASDSAMELGKIAAARLNRDDLCFKTALTAAAPEAKGGEA